MKYQVVLYIDGCQFFATTGGGLRAQGEGAGFRPGTKVAGRGALMFFMLSELNKMHTFHHYSLNSFIIVFQTAVTGKRTRVTWSTTGNALLDMILPKKRKGLFGKINLKKVIASNQSPEELQKRLDYLLENITYQVFNFSRRGLFDRHKLILATQLTIKVLSREGKLKDSDRLAEAADADVLAVPHDVRDAAGWCALRDRLRSEWPTLDLLVNAAGVGATGEVGTLPETQWRRVLDTNLLGTALGCETFLPWLREHPRRSHVVNVASIAGILSVPSMAAYSASKAGVVALSEAIAAECARGRPGVTVVCPGFFRSGLLGTWHFTSSVERCEAERRMAERIRRRPHSEIVRLIEFPQLVTRSPFSMSLRGTSFLTLPAR
jgi:NAD(P)-dependent dehydrogenase (short-subunit alcohol dehydrogenase family)